MNTNVYEPVKPIVETKYGKLRGVTYGGVEMYFGIPYAKAGRFQMPQDPESWDGVRNAYKYGPMSLPMAPPQVPFYYRGLFLHQAASENCQNLNVWAPKRDGKKKPVFVWLHGGGFMAGNALEEYSFDGMHLSQAGDIVFVSVNHRLNILGYMNLSDYGPEFANTPNLGLADLVSAMKWVHENIEAFGGDPENVTICGHSGGGGKVLCLYQMEEAAPYFQRGICLSGTTPQGPATEWEDTKLLAKSMLDTLGITKENIQEVYTVPFYDLVRAYQKVARKMWEDGHYVIFEPQKNDYFPGFPPFTPFCPGSAHKPLLISSTLGEFGGCGVPVEEKRTMTVADKEAYLRKQYGENADKLMALFRQAYPTHDILDMAYVDTTFRIPAVEAAMGKASVSPENTYLCLSAYNMAEDEGIPMWHGGEVCYAFLNEDRVYVANEAEDGPKKAAIFSSMILNFCKNGTPNTPELPQWPPFTTEHPVTMVVDRQSQAKENSDTDLMQLLQATVPPFRFPPMYADDEAIGQIGV